MGHLKNFGGSSYAYKPEEQRSEKLDTRAQEVIQSGYCRGSTYRVFLSDELAIIERRVVKQIENQTKPSLKTPTILSMSWIPTISSMMNYP